MEYRLGIYEKAMPNGYAWREKLETARRGGSFAYYGQKNKE